MYRETWPRHYITLFWNPRNSFWSWKSRFLTCGCWDRSSFQAFPESKVNEAYMGTTRGRQDPGGPNVGPMSLVISVNMYIAHIHQNLCTQHDWIRCISLLSYEKCYKCIYVWNDIRALPWLDAIFSLSTLHVQPRWQPNIWGRLTPLLRILIWYNV